MAEITMESKCVCGEQHHWHYDDAVKEEIARQDPVSNKLLWTEGETANYFDFVATCRPIRGGDRPLDLTVAWLYFCDNCGNVLVTVVFDDENNQMVLVGNGGPNL